MRAHQEIYVFSPEAAKFVRRMVTEICDDMEVALQQDVDTTGGWADPNDLIIWKGFVLETLNENLEIGFKSSDMLDKGFHFLMANLPGALKADRELANPTRGELSRLFFRYQMNDVLEFAEKIDQENFVANLELIKQHLSTLMEFEP